MVSESTPRFLEDGVLNRMNIPIKFYREDVIATPTQAAPSAG